MRFEALLRYKVRMTLACLCRTAVRLLLVLWAACAVAQEPPQRTVTLEGVTEYRLSNGLRVLAVPSPGADTVTVHVTYLVGSRHEGYGEKGMAHLLEHMLFKGSARYPDVKREFMARGARWNATTSFDRTNYFETLPSKGDNLEWALAMEADRMVNAFVAKADLDSEMTVVRNEFEMGENNPGGVLYQRMQRLAFAWHNYGHAIIGSRSDIERVPIERLRAFYRTWYRPDNAVLIVSGRFDEAQALGLVARYFGPIARPAQPLPDLYTMDPAPDGERTVTLRRVGETQIVSAMYRVPAARHPDYPAVDVLVNVLGTQPSGRLHKALVQSGMASWAWGGERGLHDPGLMYFGAGLARDTAMPPVRETLLRVLERLDETPVTDAEVARARTELLNDYEKAQSDAPMLVRMLSEFSALGDWRLLFLYRDRLRAVTTADVQRVARAYLQPANRVLGVFVPVDSPERTDIPDAPDITAALEALQGTSQVAFGEQFDPTPSNIESRVVRRQIANGIRVSLLHKKTRGGLANLALSLHWGDEASRTGRTTACDLAGSMLSRGSERRTRAELRDAFERLNADVSIDGEGATVRVRGERLAETLALVAEVLRRPAFSATEFRELRQARVTGAEQQRRDPAGIAGTRLARHLGPYPAGHPRETFGVDERVRRLKAVTLEQVVSCYHDFFGATGADVAVVGDFDEREIVPALEQLFGDWKNPRPFERVPARHYDVRPEHGLTRTPDKANAVLRAGLNIAMRDDDPDFPALVLANHLLGGNATARLPGRVREKDGLSYSTYSWFRASAEDRVATFQVSAIFAPENRSRVERAIREELERAVAEGFTDEEIAAGKRGLLDARHLSRSRDGGLAGRLVWYSHLGRSFAWDQTFEASVAALTAQTVHAALRRHIDPARLSIYLAGDFN